MYDENDDYNGPDSTRRGPFLFMTALVGVILVAGFGAAVSEARADPNEQTVLPADGVQSITRDGDLWTVTTDGPASEIKYMGPGAQQIICGINYGNPCTTTVTFTATGECVYLQLDGIPGHNSSDPYVCFGGTPSVPVSTPTAPSSTPTASPPATQEPEPSPSPSPTSSPTSTPESSPTVDSPKYQTTSGTSSVNTAAPSPTSVSQPAPVRLADTGTTDKLGFTLLMGLVTLLGVGVLLISRRVS